MSNTINRGCLSSIVNVDATKRFTGQDIRVQVIKTKQSNANTNLEVHLSDQDNIFVGISKADPSTIPLNSIIKITDFTINYPKRFLNLLTFQVISQETDIKTAENKNLTYHPVYKSGNNAAAQQQQQQQQSKPAPQQQYRANTTSTSLYNNNSANNRQPTSNSNNNYNNNNSNNNSNYNRVSNSGNTFRGNRSSEELPDLNSPSHQITLISEITSNMATANSACIRAMIRNKMQLKLWSKGASSEGKLFSMELVDESGEIKAAVFSDSSNNTFIDELHGFLQDGISYNFCGFYVKQANTKFNKLDHPCEINFGPNTLIQKTTENIQYSSHYKFTKIIDIAENLESVDVIGSITEFTDVDNITTKAGKKLDKLSITIVDDSAHSIQCVFWNERAKELKECNLQVGDVIAIKGAKPGSFSGKTLSFNFTSSYEINSEQIPDTSVIRQFASSLRDNNTQINSLTTAFAGSSSITTQNVIDLPLVAIKTMPSNSELVIGDKGSMADGGKKYYKTIGQLSRPVPLNEESTNAKNLDPQTSQYKSVDWKYLACKTCKKSIKDGNECGVHPKDGAHLAYRMNFKFSDETDAISIELMGRVGEQFVGCSADELNKKPQDEINNIFCERLSYMYQVVLSPNMYDPGNGNDIITRYNVFKLEKLTDRHGNLANDFTEFLQGGFKDCRFVADGY